MKNYNYLGAFLVVGAALAGCGGGGSADTAAGGAGAISTAAEVTVNAAAADPVLNQTGNPVYKEIERYKSWLSTNSDSAAALAADKTKATNIVSWQMPHGGFYKLPAWYNAPWNGSASRSEWFGADGVVLGTIDNDGTVTEIMFLGDVYARTLERWPIATARARRWTSS